MDGGAPMEEGGPPPSEGAGDEKEDVAEWFVFLPPDALKVIQQEHERQQQQQQQRQQQQQQQQQSEEPQQQKQQQQSVPTDAPEGLLTDGKKSVSSADAAGPAPPASSSSSSSGSGVVEGGDGGGVVGPLSLKALGVYFQWNLVDGLSLVLRQGENSWSPICDHPVVAAGLREWQQQQQQQEEEAAALAAKAEAAAETEAAAAFAAAAAAAVPGKKRRAATEKAAALAVAGAVAAAAATRAAFNAVDAALKYCGPDGQWMVFDVVDKVWRSKHDYDFLVATAAEGGASSQPGEENLILAAVAAAVRSPAKAAAAAATAATATAAGGGKKGEGAPTGEGGKGPTAVSPLEALSPEEKQAQLRRQQNAEKLQPKIRLYKDEEGRFKGDCVVGFVHDASVETAIKYFDDYKLTDSHTIKARLLSLKHSVVRADFTKKQGEAKNSQGANSPLGPPGAPGAPGAQQAARLRQRKRVLAARQEQARLLSWDAETADGRAKQRIVVLRPMYSLEEAEVRKKKAPK
ncbi:hypothetical protein Emed_007019 [Eimeria media]